MAVYATRYHKDAEIDKIYRDIEKRWEKETKPKKEFKLDITDDDTKKLLHALVLIGGFLLAFWFTGFFMNYFFG